MIKQAILQAKALGHKVQPMKDGRVFVQESLAVKAAKELEQAGLLNYASLSESSNKGFVHQGICIVR